MTSVLQKLHVRSRVEAALLALKRRLDEDPTPE
jgi:DNA-binding NarL/FixJ family response regulator